MADKKEDIKAEDKKDKGPKSEDSSRRDNPDSPAMSENANRDLQDRRGTVFGDNTSSTGGANNPGQHGRDGGEINEQSNNPAPTEDVIKGERADDMQKSDKELQHPAEEQAKDGEIKKL